MTPITVTSCRIAAVILAAGLGKRMRSNLPKVLHEAAGKPLIDWVADAARGAGASKLIAVVGPEMTSAEKLKYLDGFETVVQRERLGTGHAAQQAVPLLGPDIDEVLVLCGDVPCIGSSTLAELIAARRGQDLGAGHSRARAGAAAAVLTMMLDDPGAYGRIIRSSQDPGSVIGIVEQRDASPNELLIKEVNSGTYVFRRADLLRGLSRLKPDNAQAEYYITDVVRDCVVSGERVVGVVAESTDEMLGVNTPEELAIVDRYLALRADAV